MTRWLPWRRKRTDARAWAATAQLYAIQARKAADRAEAAADRTDDAAERIKTALVDAARRTTASDGDGAPREGWR